MVTRSHDGCWDVVVVDDVVWFQHPMAPPRRHKQIEERYRAKPYKGARPGELGCMAKATLEYV